MLLVILMSLVYNVIADGEMEGFIVGGAFADIKDYSHSAYLATECLHHDGKKTVYACGSSIVNQAILLTAAHCFESCVKNTKVSAFAGNVYKKRGMLRIGNKLLVHKNYNENEISNDVALVRLNKNLDLGANVKRVVLMKEPPYQEEAAIAGWGMVDVAQKIRTNVLKHLVKQPVMSRKKCLKVLGKLPIGTLCAGLAKQANYVAKGDSGSALVVRKFIQIGLVSFKYHTISKSVVVYTDVGYFYHWIHTNAEKLYCKTSG